MMSIRLPLLLAALFITTALSAQDAKQDTSYWQCQGNINLTFNQITLTNWAQGGENSISGIGQVDVSLDYEKGKNTWSNTLALGYGTIRTSEEWRKNEDKIDFASKYGHRAKEDLFYTGLVQFKSQFTEGFNYPDDTTVIANFMAPATLLASAGMDYKPWAFLSVYLSPATSKTTFILDDQVDETTYGLDAGETVRFEFGAYLKAKFQKELFKNVSLKSKLELFNNYTDEDKGNRKNIDVDWQTTINLKVNDYISANLFTHLIYDHDIDVPKTDDEGNKYLGKGTQFKEVFGAGFSYKF